MNAWCAPSPHIDHLVDDEMYRPARSKDDGEITTNQLATLGGCSRLMP